MEEALKNEPENVVLLKEVSKDTVENNEIVVDENNARRLMDLRNRMNDISSIILSVHNATGVYNTVFTDTGVKLVRVKQ